MLTGIGPVQLDRGIGRCDGSDERRLQKRSRATQVADQHLPLLAGELLEATFVRERTLDVDGYRRSRELNLGLRLAVEGAEVIGASLEADAASRGHVEARITTG